MSILSQKEALLLQELEQARAELEEERARVRSLLERPPILPPPPSQLMRYADPTLSLASHHVVDQLRFRR